MINHIVNSIKCGTSEDDILRGTREPPIWSSPSVVKRVTLSSDTHSANMHDYFEVALISLLQASSEFISSSTMHIPMTFVLLQSW